MDINDYNSKLTAHRNQYRDAAKNLRESHEKELKNIEERNEVQRAKQQETYLKSKNELENKVEALGESYSDKTRTEIDRRQNEYRSRVMAQREDFEREIGETKSNFRRRLEELSSDYQNNLKAREQNHDQYATSAEKRYKKSLDGVRERQQKETDRASQIAADAQRQYREQAVTERRELLNQHEGDRQDLVKKVVATENQAKEQRRSEVDTMRRIKDQEIAGRQAHHETLIETQRHQNKMQHERLRDAFSETNQRLDRSARAEIARLNEETKNVTQKQAENFSSDRMGLERKIASLEDHHSYSNEANTEDRIRKANEARVKNIFAKMEEQQEFNTLKEKELEAGFKNELDLQAERSRKTIGEKDQEINRLNLNVIGDMKQKHMENVEVYQKGQRETQARAENDVLRARNSSKREADKLHLRYGQQITSLQENNSQLIANMRTEQAKEQTEFFKDVERRTRNERLEMQDQFHNKFSTKVDQLQHKITKLEQDRTDLIDKYELRISQMKKQEAENTRQQQIINEDRRAEDQRSFQRTFVTQQREFDDQLKSIKRDVEQQIAKIKHFNDVQLSTITRDYESRLVRERQEQEKEMKIKLAEAESNYLRLESLHKSQMNSMREQYEGKMDKMRQSVLTAETKQEQRSGYLDS